MPWIALIAHVFLSRLIYTKRKREKRKRKKMLRTPKATMQNPRIANIETRCQKFYSTAKFAITPTPFQACTIRTPKGLVN